MSNYKYMISKLDEIIDDVTSLSITEGEEFLAALKKRIEYVELLFQANKAKDSFKNIPKQESTDPKVENNDAFISKKQNALIYGTTNITDNDLRFGILRFSKTSDLSKNLLPKIKILIRYKEENYQGSIPKAVPGRINGLSSLYEHDDFKSKRKITVKYSCDDKILYIE